MNKANRNHHPIAQFLANNATDGRSVARASRMDERGKLGALLKHFGLGKRKFDEETARAILQRIIRGGITQDSVRKVLFDAVGSSVPSDRVEGEILFVRSRGFYRSQKWRNLRLRFIAQQKDICCSACGATPDQIHVDHIYPKSIYPELALKMDNLQLLCEACNMGKGNTVVKRFSPRKGAAA